MATRFDDPQTSSTSAPVIRRRFRTLIFILASALAGYSTAQTAAESSDSDEGDDDTSREGPRKSENIVDRVTVYGSTASQQRAIESKRQSLQILDGVSQDDIGKLPDLDTAGVLRRIPGVNVQEDQGEPRFPVIRGLNPSFNRVVVDGGIVASPERGTRTVPLDILPASMLKEIQVVKTPTPDQDPNAIGGTINLITRSAFDEDRPFADSQVFIGHVEQNGDGGVLFSDDTDGKLPIRGNLTAGTRFGPNGQFGVVAGFNYSRRAFEVTQIETDDSDFTEFDDTGNNVGLRNGNGVVVPTNNRLFFYNNNRRQISGHGRFEWRPSENFSLDASGFYAEFNDDERRDEERFELGTGANASTPETISDQTAFTGVSQEAFGIIGLGRFVIDRSIYTGRVETDWDMTDSLNWTTQAVYSGGSLDNPESTESFQTDTSIGAVFDVSSFFQRFTPLDAQQFADPSNFPHNSRGELQRDTDDDIIEITSSLSYDVDFADSKISLKAGGIYRERERTEFGVFTRFTADPSLGFTLADAFNTQINPVDFQNGQRFTFRIDDLGATEFFEANRESFSASTPFEFGLDAEEDVYGGFGMITAQRGPLTAIGGVRIEQTDFEGQDVNSSVPVDGSYTNVLGNLQGRWLIRDDLALRVAFTQTIGRPDLSDFSRALSLGDTSGTNQTISFGNPDLDPRTSDNIDLSLEWYIPGNGILAIGGFYKNIEDEIFNDTRFGVPVAELPAAVANQLDPTITSVDINQPLNSSSADILGLEAQFQHKFSWLPAPFNGFGFSGNVTVLDTEFEVPLASGEIIETGLLQQPDLIGNATGFYQTELLEVRISYNYADEFLDSTAGTFDRFTFWDSQGQIDMQARFNVTDDTSFLFEAQNVNTEGRLELSGPEADFLQESARFGRTFWFGLNVSL